MMLVHQFLDSLAISRKAGIKQFLQNERINFVARMSAKLVLGGFQNSEIQYLLMRMPVVGKFRVELPDGRNLIITADGSYADPISKALFFWGFAGHEPEVAKIFYVLAKRSGTILDIGANIGFFSLLASVSNRRTRIVAFEPSPNPFRSLKANIEANHATTVTLVQMAATAQDGNVTLYIRNDNETYSSILGDGGQSVTKMDVYGVSIDSFLTRSGIDRVDLVKIDVEGAEPQVLEGMQHTVEKDEPDVICEVFARNEDWLTQFFSSFGYSFYWINREGLQEREVVIHDEKYRHNNYLFTKKKFSRSCQFL